MKHILSSTIAAMVCLSVAAQDKVIIKPEVTYQTLEGFGASDCIHGEYVGAYFKDAERNKAAKLLFDSTFNSQKKANGIGLSIWRFNVGSGSQFCGDDCKEGAMNDRRTGCYLTDDWSEYDWTRQPGQRWFLSKAKEYGVRNFVAFSNSPLIKYSRNGKAYCPGDGRANIQFDKYKDFSRYYMTVLKHVQDEIGIEFKYFSPANEPQWGWNDVGAEGSQYSNSDIKELCVNMDFFIDSLGLNTKLAVGDAGSWEHLSGGTGLARNQLYEFFDPASSNYIGDLPSVARLMTAHSYFTDKKNSSIISVRQKAYNAAKKYGLSLQQTEWSLLSEPNAANNDLMDGLPDSASKWSENDIALYLAKIIHSDLAFANVTSWVYWTAMDKERWYTKNRYMLIKLIPSGGNKDNTYVSVIDNPGTVQANKSLWALGQYSMFIRPGYQRIQMQGADDIGTLCATSYISPDRNRIVSVYVNMSYEDKRVQPMFGNIYGKEIVTQAQYRTDPNFNLTDMRIPVEFDGEYIIDIPARSINTVVYDLRDMGSNLTNQYDRPKMTISPNPIQDNRLHIEIPVSANINQANMQIISVDGKIVWETTVNLRTGVADIELPAIPQGHFIVRITDNDTRKNIIGRFVK